MRVHASRPPWVFTLLHLGLGLTAIICADRRFTSPSYDRFRTIGAHFDASSPLKPWGWLFLAVAVGFIIAGSQHERMLFWCTVAGWVLVSFSAVLFLWAAVTDAAAGPWGPVLLGVLAFLHFRALWYRRADSSILRPGEPPAND